jgi:formylglycine-generating enzyme required for sulfatase activity
VSANAVAVSNGFFTVTLDFGAGVFTGEARWLAIAVKTNGAASFTALVPRQPLTPSPYALYAPSAGAATTAATASVANTTAANAVNTASLQANSVIAIKLADGAITDAKVSASGISGDKVVGGDVQARRLKVGQGHTLSGDLATIAGGLENTATGAVATVSGGWANEALAGRSTIGGGAANTARGWSSTVGGGELNQALTNYATVAGGQENTVTGAVATVGGGYQNVAGALGSIVGGGTQNTATGDHAAVVGGDHNTGAGGASFIGGGSWNTITSDAWLGTIPGGWSNKVSGALGFAAGWNAKARHWGSFVRADGQDKDFSSTVENQFSVRASGGVRFETGGSGVSWGGSLLGVDQGGTIELGNSLLTNSTPYIDFHYGVGKSQDYSVRMINTAANQLTVVASDWQPLMELKPADSWLRSDGIQFFTSNWIRMLSLERNGDVIIDHSALNTNGMSPGLKFGGSGSGEGIASKRSWEGGGNGFGLDFYTAFQPRLSIANNGNIGIGTTNPTAALEVAGTVRGTRFEGDGSALTGISTGGVGDNSITAAKLASDAASLAKVSGGFMVNSASKVGIGTTTPATALDVAGTVKATAFQGDGSALTGISGGGGVADNSIIAAKLASDSLSLTKVSGGVMANAAGNIGITIPASGDTIQALNVDVASFFTETNANASHFLRLRDVGAGGQIAFVVKGNGDVGIGTATPAAKLDVGGMVKATGLQVGGAVAIGNTTDSSPPAGTIRWTGADFEGYTGANWVSLTGRASQPPTNTVTSYTNLVWIPPGTFVMGSPTNEVDRQPDEGPPTTVTLTRGFYIGKYEVTQGEYLSLMNTNPSHFTAANGYGDDLSRPVAMVSWNDAVSFCLFLTQREQDAGWIPATWQYRLPTEAEWEYACRAGTMTRFSYGDDLKYALLHNYAWYVDNSGATTHPVGRKLHNPWGLDDMCGNVDEWCQDSYDTYPGGSVTDPQGDSVAGLRVYRGGSLEDSGGDCRSAKRYYHLSTFKHLKIGFRIVLAQGQ